MRPSILVIAVLSLAVGCASQRAETANTRGRDCLAKRDYRCAATAFGEAVQLRPDVAKYHYNLGLTHARAGALEPAASELREALRLKPGDPEFARVADAVARRLEDRRAGAVADEITARIP